MKLHGLILFLAFFCVSCATVDRPYNDQVDLLMEELAAQSPRSVEEVCDFAALRSHRINLNLEGLNRTLIFRMASPGPWYERVLAAYLLALAEDDEGFFSTLLLLGDSGLSPMLREGLQYSAMHYLGFTERDRPPQVSGEGWTQRLGNEAAGRIREIGLENWRLEYLSNIIHSGTPSSGDEAVAAAEWLSFTLQVRDVAFLHDLIERGSSRCDQALLYIIENLLIQEFVHGDTEEDLVKGIEEFRSWFAENASLSPDTWISKAFFDAGYKVTDIYNQNAISKVVEALYDDSEKWVLLRGRALAALNRICGFHMDRALIFMPEEERRRAARSCMEWYEELAERVSSD